MATISKADRRRLAEEDRARQKAQRKRDQQDAEIDQLIAETGWAVCTADTDGPPHPAPHFGYTIGRSLKGHPELCTYSHSRDDIATVLNLAGAILEKDGHVPVQGEVLTVPMVGAWEIINVPGPLLEHLEYAQRRYTFVRAVRLRRIA